MQNTERKDDYLPSIDGDNNAGFGVMLMARHGKQLPRNGSGSKRENLTASY
jgi:hypothetical protein